MQRTFLVTGVGIDGMLEAWLVPEPMVGSCIPGTSSGSVGSRGGQERGLHTSRHPDR